LYSFEFPGQTTLLILMPVNLHHGLVDGAVYFEDGTCSGALPGKLLRSTQVIV